MKNILFGFIIGLIIGAGACYIILGRQNNEVDSFNNKTTSVDQSTTESSISKTIAKDYFQRPVDPLKAGLCTALYRNRMPTGIKWGSSSNPLLTNGVIFEGITLKAWIDQILSTTPDAKFKIMPCIYHTDYIDYAINIEHDPNAKPGYKNRLSVLIWPCNKSNNDLLDAQGNAVRPYNLGGLYP